MQKSSRLVCDKERRGAGASARVTGVPRRSIGSSRLRSHELMFDYGVFCTLKIPADTVKTRRTNKQNQKENPVPLVIVTYDGWHRALRMGHWLCRRIAPWLAAGWEVGNRPIFLLLSSDKGS